jgi:hypothetical protein
LQKALASAQLRRFASGFFNHISPDWVSVTQFEAIPVPSVNRGFELGAFAASVSPAKAHPASNDPVTTLNTPIHTFCFFIASFPSLIWVSIRSPGFPRPMPGYST